MTPAPSPDAAAAAAPVADASAFPPPPPIAGTCPKCGVPSSPKLQTQTCEKCGTPYVLRAGALMDRAVKVPPVDPSAKDLKLKAPGLMVMSQAMLKPNAIGFGALDPILGRFPMDEQGVRFDFLYSIALWRTVNVAQALTFFVISLPVGLGAIAALATLSVPGTIFGLPFLALAAFHGWRVFGARATRVRVVGFKDRVLDMTFAGSVGKRQRFVDELFRRCGLEPVQLP